MPATPPGGRPLSPPGAPQGMQPAGPPASKDPQDQAAASLGELAVAFLGAGNDPAGAAALLLEFLNQAGYQRSR
jgi:hypothetical protein